MICLDTKFDDITLKKPAELVLKKLGIELSPDGFPVDALKGASLNIKSDGTKGCITYTTRVSFFRMLTEFIKEFKKHKEFNCFENIEVENCGVMLDLSRNGVMKPEALADYFTYMAMTGLNFAMLYMEDVYTIDERPYFGYLRGRYTKDEFRAIDDAADMFGIEVYPAIQTLSHLEMYIKNVEAFPARDTSRLLCIGQDATYELIDAMFKNISGVFRSKKLHLGMDEAWNIGKGEYLKYNGGKLPEDLGDIFTEHLKKVIKMAAKYGFELEMWNSSIGHHCRPEHFADFEEFKDVRVWHGTYEGDFTEEEFLKILHFYDDFGMKDGITGATQTWYGCAPENNFSLGNANNIMTYCKKHGVSHVCDTIWMNDGTECNHFFSLLGAIAYGEHMYNKVVTPEHIKEKFELITGTSYDAFMDMSLFHNKDMNESELIEDCGSRFWGKKLLYQDIMMGMWDKNLYDAPMSEHYVMCRDKFAAYKNLNDNFCLHYEYFESLFDVLALKCYIAERLKPAYDKGDKEFLKLAADNLLPELKGKVEKLKSVHCKQWHNTYKAFGFEIIDARYSAIAGRCDTASCRLSEYLNGEVNTLDELDETRLIAAVHYDINYLGISSMNHHWPSII